MKVLFFMDESSMTYAFCVHQLARPARLKQASELRCEDSSFRFSSQGDLKRQVVQFLGCDYGEFKVCTSLAVISSSPLFTHSPKLKGMDSSKEDLKR